MEETFFESCGYVATFVGTMLEGAISLVTSSIGARLGNHNFFIAMFLAFLGASIGDWSKYLAAKTQGQKLLDNKPKIQAKINSLTKRFDDNPNLILTFYKLFFGASTIILIIAGIRNVSYTKFAIHSAIGIALWIIVLGGLGYLFGEVIIMGIKNISYYAKYIILGLGLIAVFRWFFFKRKTDKYCMECLHPEEVN